MVKRHAVQLTLLVIMSLLVMGTSAASVRIRFEVPAIEDEQFDRLYEYWLSDFSKQNPGIEVVFTPRATDWRTKTPLEIASGVGPDVVWLSETAGPAWAQTGVLLDLDSYIKRDMPERDIKDFFPSAWAIGIAYTDKGPIHYGLPPNVNMNMMFYNKTHFDQAGLPYISVLDKQGVWTWDKLVEVSKRLTKQNGDGRTTQWGFGQNAVWTVTCAAPFIYAAGGNFFDWPANPNKYVLDQRAAIDGLNFFYDLVWKHRVHPYPKAIGYAAPNATTFGSGLYSMMGLWFSNIKTMQMADLSSWDIGPRPLGPKSRGYMTGVDQIGISAKTRYPEEAWRLVRYITSRAAMEVDAQYTGRGPARFSAAANFARLDSKISLTYYMQGAEGALPNPNGVIQNAQALPLIQQVITRSIRDGQVPPEQAIRESADAVKAFFR